jgi:glycosyltransferase involved in cell wall biosynthesis
MYRPTQAKSSLSVTTVVAFLFAISIAFLLGMNFGNHPSPFFFSSSSSASLQTPTTSSDSKNKLAVDAHNKNKQNKFNCPPPQLILSDSKKKMKNEQVSGDDNDDDEIVSGAESKGIPSKAVIQKCVESKMKSAEEYVKFAEQSAKIRQEKGPLTIAAFSRLWVPPLHGTGGMQFHALHLYSQLAVKGHRVHVFVTGPSNENSLRNLMYNVDPETHTATTTHDESKASLFVHQVSSSDDGEYSVAYFENSLKKIAEVNASIIATGKSKKGFDVVHSESWAGVPNIYQMGLPAFVTWHGSMLDWFRNEINFIVHNFRMKGKMTGESTAQRMKDLGSSVAYESYMLLSVPDHIVISDSAASDLKKVNLVDPDAVHVIYNGVNTKSFKPADDRDATRKSFLTRVAKMDSNEIEKNYDSLFLIGCGGRLDGIKGHHQLSVAIKTVLAKKPNAVLLVAGKGHESHRYEDLKAQGLRVYLLGMLNQKDLALFYQTVDVFVDPFYQHHGLNTVMLEASLTGVPIVVTNLASSETTCPCNGGFGLTFPLGEPAVLAERLIWLEEHPVERREMGAAGRKRAQLLFSSSVMASRYEHLLYEAVEHPRPLVPITGKITCKHAYPKMCYRAPFDIPEGEGGKKKKKKE